MREGRPWITALITVACAFSWSCDSDGLGAFADFADTAAGAICHRTFECCADLCRPAFGQIQR